MYYNDLVRDRLTDHNENQEEAYKTLAHLIAGQNTTFLPVQMKVQYWNGTSIPSKRVLQNQLSQGHQRPRHMSCAVCALTGTAASLVMTM
jgi:hypothetical protein